MTHNWVSRIQYAVLATGMLIAPLLLVAWFSLCPQYGNPQCPTSANIPSALVAFRTADSNLMSVFLTISTLVPYVYPLSYIGLGVVAMKRSPWLATIGIILGWIGSIAWGLIGPAEFVYYDAARINNDTVAAGLLSSVYMHWQIYYIVAGGWVIGHLAGYLILGIALWRAKTTPRWASLTLVISAPLMGPIAYGLNNGWVQVAGYAMVFAASMPAAWSFLDRKTSCG